MDTKETRIAAKAAAGADDTIRCYQIVRIYYDDRPTRVIRRHYTQAEAQEYCSRPDTKQPGVYFDGYDLMVPRKRTGGRS